MKKSSILILLFSFTIILFAQQKPIVKTPVAKPSEQPAEIPSGKFVGMMFNDYSYTLQEPQTLNPSKGKSGNNSFLFRRATIGYDYSFNKNVTAKIVYDGSNSLIQQKYYSQDRV